LRAYGLLKEALVKSSKAGVGSFVMREREHVCMIKPYENILVLTRLRFAEEIRDTPQIKSVAAKAKPAEIKMAMSLIEQLTETFDPSLFKDEYSEKLMKIIKAKAKGKQVTYKPMKIVHSKTTDLMEQLKASLASNKKKAS
jgi:DNA end-binding protein Ku